MACCRGTCGWPRRTTWRRPFTHASMPYRDGTAITSALTTPHVRHSGGVSSGRSTALCGQHCFRAFAVKGTAPERDAHLCTVTRAVWHERPGGLVFEIEANRFLHHMVRLLVGTMADAASGRRDPSSVSALLGVDDNSGTSAPAPPHALFLDAVIYPPDLYVTTA